MMNKIDGIVKKYSSGGGRIVYSHNGSRHDKRDRDINRQTERRKRFSPLKWTSYRRAAVTGPAILSAFILISISYYIILYLFKRFDTFFFFLYHIIVPRQVHFDNSKNINQQNPGQIINGRIRNYLHRYIIKCYHECYEC